ncbi:MAG: Myc-type, basic helix-loop-helix domain-containing protein [Benjaminiella poitrasii]|nr:MAG: Myc-type, basic helix-loop-helix domain-containing protein [Benjaminiella poitrasii]
MQMMLEKKRRRRESHNAVERRRRDNINERINELLSLLPNNQDAKLSKGTILRHSVNHIHFLHDKLRVQQQRIHELETLINMYHQQNSMIISPNVMDLSSPIPNSSSSSSHSSLLQHHHNKAVNYN